MTDISGVGAKQRILTGLSDPEKLPSALQERLDRIKQGVANGRVDPAALEARLVSGLGDGAKGLVAEDGTINFVKIEALMQQRMDEFRSKWDNISENSFSSQYDMQSFFDILNDKDYDSYFDISV